MAQAQPSFSKTYVIEPGPGDPGVAEKWARRLADPATIQEIKDAIQGIQSWRAVLDAAAEGYAEFMNTSDPRQALAAIKHRAALSLVDAEEARQKLLNALDTKFGDAVQGAKEKFTMRTRYILPVTSAAAGYANDMAEFLGQLYGMDIAKYLRAGAVPPFVYVAYVGVVLADAAAQGGVTVDEANSIVAAAAGELERILDIIVAEAGYDASVATQIVLEQPDPNTRVGKLQLTISINPKA